MSKSVEIESGFAVTGAGTWLMGRGQPTAVFGAFRRLRRKGWIVRDRSSLSLVEVTGLTMCADAMRPFLTHIPCATSISAVSGKVLVASADARIGAELVKVVPMSARGAICITKFGSLEGENQTSNFVVMATASRTARLPVEDGDTLSVRTESVVAWTGNRPTGFVRKLGVWDVLLPRTPRDLMLHFHGPCIVWVEGANYRATQPPNHLTFRRNV